MQYKKLVASARTSKEMLQKIVLALKAATQALKPNAKSNLPVEFL